MQSETVPPRHGASVLALIPAGQSAADPPYPAEIRARGWAFDLYYERIDQSKTWLLAPAEVRPWLLMLWYQSWKQVPVGTLPNDDEVIAALIGCPLPFFKQHRRHFLSGWSLRSDGLLYHDHIVELVLAMIAQRRKDSERQKQYRSKNQEVGGDVHVSHTGVTRDSTVNTTPTPTPTPLFKDENPSGSSPTSDDVAGMPASMTIPKVDHQRVIDAYHETLPTLPRVMSWTPKRQASLRQRWREFGMYWRKKGKPWQSTADGVEAFRKFFTLVARSKHLTGGSPPREKGGEPWMADLPWLLVPENFVKVCEGRYS